MSGLAHPTPSKPVAPVGNERFRADFGDIRCCPNRRTSLIWSISVALPCATLYCSYTGPRGVLYGSGLSNVAGASLSARGPGRGGFRSVSGDQVGLGGSDAVCRTRRVIGPGCTSRHLFTDRAEGERRLGKDAARSLMFILSDVPRLAVYRRNLNHGSPIRRDRWGA